MKESIYLCSNNQKRWNFRFFKPSVRRFVVRCLMRKIIFQ